MNVIEQEKYDERFYDSQAAGSLRSAKIVLPLVKNLIQPASVLDVGCGVGAWLKVWKDNLGVSDIIGIDGEYVSRESLQIPEKNFISKDLKGSFALNRKFDLVMSLEVGEHLPHETSAQFISNLVSHGNIVLFSAAMLHQTGTYHINEQLPEFWASLFMKHDYMPVDIIRDKIWNDDTVEWWYRQNILLYVHRDILNRHPLLMEKAKHTNPDCLVRIHPLLWKYRNEEVEIRSHWISFIRWKLAFLTKPFKKKKNGAAKTRS
ncbi:MAG: class I SAM-dependent methyltransferase [Chitinophagaceae bacterium]|nr:class I SAM-dependent methyltransferase [Chitinophagaceae bacterium]